MIELLDYNYKVLSSTAEPIHISYKEGRFAIWMRILKNGSLTLFPRRLEYVGTFFITRGQETFIYSLPSDKSKEISITTFIRKLSTRCTKFQYNELPEILQAKLA